MNEQAKADLAEIESVIGAPAPKASPIRPVKPDAGAGVLVAPKKAAEPTRAPLPDNVPDVETDAGVRSARDAHARIQAKIDANAREQREAETALGLRPNPNDTEIDALAVKLIVADGDETATEKLRALRRRGALLVKAAAESRAAIGTAIEAARRVLAEEARVNVWLPKYRAAVLSKLRAMRDADDLRIVCDQLRGLGLANGIFPLSDALPADGRAPHAVIGVLNEWIRTGAVTREDIAEYLPGTLDNRVRM